MSIIELRVVLLLKDAESSNFFMELSGGSGNGERYSAVAFSPDGRMADSDVYFCSGNEVVSGAIRDEQRQPAADSSLPVSSLLFESNLLRPSFPFQ